MLSRRTTAAICGSRPIVRRALGVVEDAMFGLPNTRLAELSRADYDRNLTEFARLEYPREDPRSILTQALRAAPASRRGPTDRLRWFRPFGRVKEGRSAKA